MKTNARKLLREIHPDLDKASPKETVRRQMARRLREARKARGLTQEEVAKRSGMAQSQIATLESPKGNMPRVDSLQRYMAACDIPIYIGFPDLDDILREDIAHDDTPADKSGDLDIGAEARPGEPEAVSAGTPQPGVSISRILSEIEELQRHVALLHGTMSQDKTANQFRFEAEDFVRHLDEARKSLAGLAGNRAPLAKRILQDWQKDSQGASVHIGAARVELMDIVSMKIVDSISVTKASSPGASDLMDPTWAAGMQTNGNT